MNVYGLWYGGCSYAPPSVPEDLEPFESIRAAAAELERRYHGGGGEFPAVTRESEILLYPYPDSAFVDPCRVSPFKRVYFGPRGGVRVEDL